MLGVSTKVKGGMLVDTSCSVDMEESDWEEVTTTKGKKRVGRYSFYYKHLLGSGYGGRVYKGIRDNSKENWFAIKVIRLKEMSAAHRYMLSN